MRRIAVLLRRIPLGIAAAVGGAVAGMCALLAVNAYQPTRNWATCTQPLHRVAEPGKPQLLCHFRDMRFWTTHPHETAALAFLGGAIVAAVVAAGALVVRISRTDVSDTPAAAAHRRRFG